MERCWKENPEERPSFENIYNSLESMLTDNEVSTRNNTWSWPEMTDIINNLLYP